MTGCPNCSYVNKVGVLICEQCGIDLYDLLLQDISTKKLSNTLTRELDDSTIIAHPPFIIYVGMNKEPIAVERFGECIIGRQDTTGEDLKVDINLQDYGAQEKGVSRQHARLFTNENPPILVDLDSANGTFVNGQRLVPQQPHYLRSGDELRLGRLTMRVYYK